VLEAPTASVRWSELRGHD